MIAPGTILVLIATERVSGPLKGIFQCLRYLDRSRYRAVLGLVRARRSEPSDAEREAAARGIPFAVLDQSGAFDLSLIRRAHRLAREHGAGLVQTHGYKSHLLGFLLKRATGLPWLGFAHGWTAETWRVRLYHRLDWLLRYADHVVAVSDELDRQLLRMGVAGARLTRIHNAVEPDEGWSTCLPGTFRQTHGIPLDVPLLTVIGRITREKGQRIFIEAFHRLTGSFPQARAAIVGEGIDAGPLQVYTRSLGLSERVHFVDWYRPSAPVYVDSDVIVLPSTAFEGVPNVLLEAMAAGRPVVATTVGGTPEVATHEQDALLVPPADPGALAGAMTRLLEDKPLRDRLAEKARHRMLVDHSPTRRAERIGQVYDALLRR